MRLFVIALVLPVALAWQPGLPRAPPSKSITTSTSTLSSSPQLRQTPLIVASRRSPPPLLSAGPFAVSTALFGAANALGLGLSALTGWHYHLDIIGTGIFAVAAYASRGASLTQGCSAAAVALWAIKLACVAWSRSLSGSSATYCCYHSAAYPEG